MTNFKACHYCKERYSGCHSVCPKYIKEKTDWEETKQIIAENKDFDFIAYVVSKRHKRRFK